MRGVAWRQLAPVGLDFRSRASRAVWRASPAVWRQKWAKALHSSLVTRNLGVSSDLRVEQTPEFASGIPFPEQPPGLSPAWSYRKWAAHGRATTRPGTLASTSGAHCGGSRGLADLASGCFREPSWRSAPTSRWRPPKADVAGWGSGLRVPSFWGGSVHRQLLGSPYSGKNLPCNGGQGPGSMKTE